ncbi:hypothetical protein GQ43DRAFT_385268 [Delitschia confertaspora ATCC 74209]|uniref:Uncharacterized protein n=1 Tax=Delitschia confertaspora ATCC 74209 TaxID=1513339 RepID=A0A9P4JY89_9PLEO|nr:hypothetical protein GQ43DRAFT_385268 [Delitschia confertaspora ATCC 74209]
MANDQPFLYNAPKRYSADDLPDTFNPKAVTMASRQPPPPPKPKPIGPLVDFNTHPDSYLILPYGRTDAKPLGKKTKTLIKGARWIQLFFRALQLLGAIGVLLCAIFIKGTGNTEGFIIRIPPGVDIVVSLYAIYHLLRAAKARTPASSASYHFFALMLDAGFIPFYVFTALLSNRNFNQQSGTNGRWRTFFTKQEDTETVLHTTWLTATAVGGLHCVSLFLDLYLVLIFRKISKLPPDMNPLEEHLTARPRRAMHKHSKSSISTTKPLMADEKRFSTQSGTSITTTGSGLSSHVPTPDAEKMSFLHTRGNSEVKYSPHTPASVNHNRNSLYSQAASNRASRANLNSRDDLHLRDNEEGDETLSQRKAYLTAQAIKRGSRPNSMVPSKQDTSHDLGEQSFNWFVHSDTPAEDPADPAAQYKALLDHTYLSDEEENSRMVPQPLRMNPPSPTRSLTPQRTKSKRYYGDLKAAREAILPQKDSFADNRSRSRSPVKDAPAGLTQTSFASVRRTGEAGYTPIQGHSPRVVSRSGVDYIGDYSYEDDSYLRADASNQARGRNVSGAIAEEGRGGLKTMGGLTYRRVSGMA